MSAALTLAAGRLGTGNAGAAGVGARRRNGGVHSEMTVYHCNICKIEWGWSSNLPPSPGTLGASGPHVSDLSSGWLSQVHSSRALPERQCIGRSGANVRV